MLQDVLTVANLYRKQLETIARSERQTRVRWSVLSASREGRTVPQVARLLGMARQNVQRVADELAEARLVRFEPNPDHRRSPRLRLTPEGEALNDRLERKLRSWDPVDADLGDPEDVETALGVLRALRSRLERSL